MNSRVHFYLDITSTWNLLGLFHTTEIAHAYATGGKNRAPGACQIGAVIDVTENFVLQGECLLNLSNI